MALPHGTTIKFPAKVKQLMKQDAKKEGLNLSQIARKIIMQHYGLLGGAHKA